MKAAFVCQNHPWRPYTHEQIFLVQKLAGMTQTDYSFGTRLLAKKNMSIFGRTHERIKLIKEILLV
jgi:hypothetical protein